MDNIYEIPTSRFYCRRNLECLNVKSAFMLAFSFIERKLKVRCNMNMSDEISESSYIKIQEAFHNIKQYSYNETVQYFELLSRLRNINAHFFRCDPIFCDNRYDFIFNNLDKNIKIPYKFIVDNKLTFYGMIVVISILLDKGFINRFVQRLLNNSKMFRCYLELDNTNNAALINHYKTLILLTKNDIYDKQDHNSTSSLKIDNVTFGYLNEVLNDTLTKLIFEFEFLLSKKYDYYENHKPYGLKDLLQKEKSFINHNEEINDLVMLRNIWLHGYWIYDSFECNGKKQILTLEIVLNVLKKWKILLTSLDNNEYTRILKAIDDFGIALIKFKYCRLIEISLKICVLDLYKSEKIISRTKGANNAFELINNPSDLTNIHIDLAFELIGNKKQLYIHKDKFSDSNARMIEINQINIFHFKSSKEILINNDNTSSTEIALYEMPAFIKQLSSINGKSLHEYKASSIYKLNNLVNIYEITLD